MLFMKQILVYHLYFFNEIYFTLKCIYSDISITIT